MFDHVGIQAADVDAAVSFYLKVFGPLGFTEAIRYPVGPTSVVGLAGRRGFPAFWIGPADGEETREIHLAFTALSTDEVDAVHTAAVEAGAEILHAPRIFPEYHPGYYGVFVRDLDGHNVEAVHHLQAPGDDHPA